MDINSIYKLLLCGEIGFVGVAKFRNAECEKFENGCRMWLLGDKPTNTAAQVDWYALGAWTLVALLSPVVPIVFSIYLRVGYSRGRSSYRRYYVSESTGCHNGFSCFFLFWECREMTKYSTHRLVSMQTCTIDTLVSEVCESARTKAVSTNQRKGMMTISSPEEVVYKATMNHASPEYMMCDWKISAQVWNVAERIDVRKHRLPNGHNQ
jgi:hypothetical protein